MGELVLRAPFAGIAGKSEVTADAVLGLRAAIYSDGHVSREDAEALFAIDGAVPRKCPEWGAFFVEAVTDHVVHQEKPSGHISEANAGWLTAAITRDGQVATPLELELLVAALEKAKSSPARLSAFALRQVEDAVVRGEGPLAADGHVMPGMIDRAEVELIRRILHAFGGEGNIAITTAEAEVLFRINDGTVEEMNDPAWNELFVKAMTNFVLCASGYESPTRAEALRREAFLDNTDIDMSRFFARMVSGGLGAIFDAYAEPAAVEDLWEARNRAREAAERRAEHVDASEAAWLTEIICRDRLLRENERALLGMLKRSAHTIHPTLKPLLDRVA